VELGEYEMQKQIGAGKTAAVWAARVRATGEQVAIKVLNIQYLKGDKVCQSLLNKASSE
jgi:serine/threonine protein kinase